MKFSFRKNTQQQNSGNFDFEVIFSNQTGTLNVFGCGRSVYSNKCLLAVFPSVKTGFNANTTFEWTETADAAWWFAFQTWMNYATCWVASINTRGPKQWPVSMVSRWLVILFTIDATYNSEVTSNFASIREIFEIDCPYERCYEFNRWFLFNKSNRRKYRNPMETLHHYLSANIWTFERKIIRSSTAIFLLFVLTARRMKHIHCIEWNYQLLI